MLGQDPGSSGVTFGEAWTAWLAGKRKLRQSARARLEEIGAHWLMPAGGDVPLARKFLAGTAGDPLHPAYRLVLLRGLRRGEALGLRWADADLDAGFLRIRQTSLKIGGEVVTGRPKSKAGERVIWLDQQTTDLLK